jgi:WS/DGAT/MGAT family acyltransferase
VAWTERLPLATIQTIGQAHDATINDVLLVLLCGALRRYLTAKGPLADDAEMRMLVPVALRKLEDSAELGNRFGSVYLMLPIGEPDPWRRLSRLKAQMDDIKQSPEAVITFLTMAATGLAPAEMATQMVQLFQRNTTGIMTNVPGPRQPLYLCGQPLSNIIMWGPLAGRLSLGAAILSYNGGVTLGIFADAALTPDPEAICAAFSAEFNAHHRLIQ